MGLRDSFRNIFKGSSQVTIDRASKGVTRDAYYSYGRLSQSQPNANSNLNILLDMYRKDPIVNTAISKRTNASIATGYSLEGSKTARDNSRRKLDKLNFSYSFLKKLFLNATLYRHIFIEVSDPDSLHILDAPQMEIKHSIHGEIEGYVQKSVTGEEITWAPEEIVYIPMDSITSGLWGEVELKTLFRTVATKNFIENFINSLAETNAWRPYIETTMSDDQIESMLPYLREIQADPTFPWIMQKNKADSDKQVNKFGLMRDPKELNDYINILNYLRAQILMQLKVPPIVAGITDDTNRSSGDDQLKTFYMDIDADRKTIQDAFNNELFKLLGITAEFSWNPLNKRSEKDDVEIAEKLMNMGAKPDQVEKFLRNTGLELPEGEIFMKPEDVVGTVRTSRNIKGMPTPDESRPSRQRKDGSISDNIGTGADSSTKDSQLGDK